MAREPGLSDLDLDLDLDSRVRSVSLSLSLAIGFGRGSRTLSGGQTCQSACYSSSWGRALG